MRAIFAIKGLHQAAGGAERVVCEVSSALAERGHAISLLTFDAADDEAFYPISPKVQQIRLSIGDPLKPTTLTAFLLRCKALRRTVSRFHPDVVVAFMHSMFIPMGFALAGTGVPVIASEHIVREHYYGRPGEFALFLSVMPVIRKATVLSGDILKEYPWPIRRKMVTVENPVSPEFQRVRVPVENAGTKQILSIGRLVAQKDHASLISAFSLIAADFPDWTLKIIGDGEMRQSLIQLVEELRLENRILLPGIVRDVANHLEQCEFFALASRYESFGLVVAEAMAMGKATVGYDDCHGVNRLILHRKTGLLVGGEDRAVSLAAGLRWLIENPAERGKMGQNAWNLARERYSLRKIVDQWERIMIDVAA